MRTNKKREKDTAAIETAESVEARPEELHEPNIALTGDEELLQRFGGPVTCLNIGQDLTIEFPDEATQRAGWYSPHARRIVEVSPLYRLIKQKGAK